MSTPKTTRKTNNALVDKPVEAAQFNLNDLDDEPKSILFVKKLNVLAINSMNTAASHLVNAVIGCSVHAHMHRDATLARDLVNGLNGLAPRRLICNFLKEKAKIIRSYKYDEQTNEFSFKLNKVTLVSDILVSTDDKAIKLLADIRACKLTMVKQANKALAFDYKKKAVATLKTQAKHTFSCHSDIDVVMPYAELVQLGNLYVGNKYLTSPEFSTILESAANNAANKDELNDTVYHQHKVASGVTVKDDGSMTLVDSNGEVVQSA